MSFCVNTIKAGVIANIINDFVEQEQITQES